MNWLVQHGFTVYAINPKLTAAWRAGVSVNDAKSDAADARIIARGVAQHHEGLQVVAPDIPLARELALVCEDEANWIGERTALVNRLTATLKMYFPVALKWFEDWTKPSAWRFVRKYSTAQALASATEQELVAFLKGHRMRYTRRRRELLNQAHDATRLQADEATVRAMALRVVAIVEQLLKLEESLAQYRQRIEELFAQHPDAALFSSLPGAGKKLAPRLACVFGTDRSRFDSAHVVQQLSGTVPVHFDSGKRRLVKFRWGCNTVYRNTMHLFSLCSLSQCAWGRGVYDYHRSYNDSHALALRKLGSKWLKIIFRMWQNHERYDEEKYLKALKRTGSRYAQTATA